jgi:chromosome segregation ATPase
MDCDAGDDSEGDQDYTRRLAGVETPAVWKTSTNELSGGQRTLLGLAFVLSIAKYQPSPVYILDEVDAALDEGNQARVASLVSQVLGHEQRCQTIAISHHADFQRGAARVTEICKKHGVGSCVANSFDRVPS